MSKRRVQFSEDDKVLCFEPDPTKARVLYESKVNEVSCEKDERGRKVVKYFIHFNGWNRSWDRWVTEDMVLEDTEENRAVQQQLHDFAYQKVKKHSFHSPQKRRRAREKEEPSLVDTEGETTADDEVVSECDPDNMQPDDSEIVPLEIPAALKKVLEDDCFLIMRRGKLLRLPAQQCVQNILDECLDYLQSQEPELVNGSSTEHENYRAAYCSAGKTGKNKAKAPPLVVEPSSRLLLLKEVVSGLKIFFDYTLASRLLYSAEQDQYRELVRPIDPTVDVTTVMSGKGENSLGASRGEDTRPTSSSMSSPSVSPLRDEVAWPTEHIATRRRNSVCDGVKEEGLGVETKKRLSGRGRRRSSRAPRQLLCRPPINSRDSESSESEVQKNSSHLDTSGVIIQHQLRAVNSVSQFAIQFAVRPTCVYGAEHLIRLFVHLPIYLAQMSLKESELQILYQYLYKILAYLNRNRQQLFSEEHYIDR